MQALYRKYRSKSLSEVVGQEHITSTLANAIKNGRISHAYLFTGPRGVGKTSVARILAHEINQLPYGETAHLDIIEIDAASNRRIDDIRDLRDKIHIAPTSAKYKVYIIDEVHMLTGESFNALLKTLEEPPAHVIFILATTEVHKLPATIISRTQRYSFRSAEPTKLKKHLKHIAEKENITIDDEALDLIAEHGGGSFRDSISLLDQLANLAGGAINAKTVEETLGLAPKAAIKKLIEAILKKDHQAVIQQLTTLEQQGTTTSALVPQLMRVIASLAPKHTSLYPLLDQLIEVPRSYNPQIKLLAILVGNSLAEAASETPSKTTPAAVQATKPVLEVTKTPIRKQATKPTPQAAPVSSEEEGTIVGGKPLTELTLDQWASVLAKIKEQNTPIQTVLRQSQPNFDPESQVLTLTFKYPLHRRKADDNKAKQLLAKAMFTILGGAPQITTDLNAEVEAPDITLPAAPMDDTAKSVADIMGGGEAVASS